MKENLYTPEVGDVFEWCDEHYICITSGNHSGIVISVGDNYCISNFTWNMHDAKSTFIRKATSEELEQIKKRER